MKTWANASRMWNCEANSDKSGIRAAVSYDVMKEFAKSMEGYPGFTGDTEAAPKLAPAGKAADANTFLQKLTARIGNE